MTCKPVRFICLLLAVCLCFSLAGCGGGGGYGVKSIQTLVEQEYYLAFRNNDPTIYYVVAAIQVIAANEGGTVVINDAQGMVKQSTQDIYYVDVSGHKLSYHTVNGVYTELGSLSDLERVLSAYDFMRCNACYLVNPRHIRQIKSKELLVLLSNGETLKISQTKRKSFISELTNWMGQGKC